MPATEATKRAAMKIDVSDEEVLVIANALDMPANRGVILDEAIGIR